MSSREHGVLGFHLNVTPELNGTDVVEGCVDSSFPLREGYGGGACCAV
jgi:hypothetical protein